MHFKPKYSIVVPVFNSDASLSELCKRCASVFENLQETWEILLIDDGSSNPLSWQNIELLSKLDPHVKGYKLSKNSGKHSAILAGFSYAEGDYIITIDDDLQHPPEEIPKLIVLNKHDVVIGEYTAYQASGIKKLISKRKKKFEQKLLNIPQGVVVSPFKLYKKRVVKDILKIKTAYPFITALLFEVTSDVVNTPVEHHVRKLGKSQYTMGKMLQQFSNLLFNNSSYLLKLISKLGLSISALSVLAAIYLLSRKLFGLVHVSGWTSLMLTLLFIGGLILFSIGILGEYLIRIIKGVESKPSFYIQKSTLEDGEE